MVLDSAGSLCIRSCSHIFCAEFLQGTTPYLCEPHLILLVLWFPRWISSEVLVGLEPVFLSVAGEVTHQGRFISEDMCWGGASFTELLRNTNSSSKKHHISDVGNDSEWKDDFGGQIREGVEVLGFSGGERETGKGQPRSKILIDKQENDINLLNYKNS